MNGKIVKGIAGFYYVHVIGSGIYECKAKGIFRKENVKPLVGDDVQIDVLDEKDKEGNVTHIFPRKNTLMRPAVANVDQAMVVFALADPKPHLNLLDRFLMTMEAQDIPIILCFNKVDLQALGSKERRNDGVNAERLLDIYRPTNYPIVFTSAATHENILQAATLLEGKTTVIAGPSGVGKSSLINLLQTDVQMEIGNLSEKIGRGKHTTRHSQLIAINEETYIVDTPGFSSLFTTDFEKNEIKDYFVEFVAPAEKCHFQGCEHVHEPGCEIKEEVAAGRIHSARYESYLAIHKSESSRRRLTSHTNLHGIHIRMP